MDVRSWSPHGLALLEYVNGKTDAQVLVHGDDGEAEAVPARVFFRGPDDFSALEEAALELCRGRVLDVGAGAGCHALVLQERQLSVCAIDVAPEAVLVMQRRGVREVHCADLFSFQAEPCDTLLMLMNGIGVVGDLAGLQRFVREAHRLVKPDGQILLDSYDPGGPDEAPVSAAGMPAPHGSRYLGEMRFQLEYNGWKGPMLAWLFVDFDTLAEYAATAGWSAELIWQEEEGHYLARLNRIQTPAFIQA